MTVAPRFRWRCTRCARDCDEPVRCGWGPPWSSCTCGVIVMLEIQCELDGRIVKVAAAESPYLT